MRFSSLADWLVWLEAKHPTTIELGLERIARVAGRLGIDLSGARVVSIAGTNGKGSCVAALNGLGLQAGWRVGCYTSPHFLHYNERVLIDGRPVSDETLMAAFARIDAALQDDSLTYFEFGTLAALDIFQQAGLDLVLLEVGLGGRLDAVNLVDADISVVTSIALDHQDWLGDDRESIGFEKAGIYRKGKPAICADTEPPQRLLEHASTIGAQLLLRGQDFDLDESDTGGYHWWSQGDKAETTGIAGLTSLALPLPSMAAALQVAELLGIGREHWACLNHVQLPGRFHCVSQGDYRVIMDVAHNPQAAGYLAERLAREPHSWRRYALFAAMADKDIAGILEPLVSHFDGWAVTGLPDNVRAMTVGELAVQVIQRVNVPVSAFDDVPQACAQLSSSLQTGDELVVFGSFFTVAAAMAYWQVQPYAVSSPNTE